MVVTSSGTEVPAETTFQLAEGLDLKPLDTTARSATFLAQLRDGRQFQISEPLYHVLGALSVPRSLDQLAIQLQQQGLVFNKAQLRQIINEVLIPNQLLRTEADAVQPASRSLMDLHLRYDLLSEARLAPLTRRLGVLFRPPLAIVLIAMILIAHVLVYARAGFHIQTNSPLTGLPVIYLLFLGSIVIHELGHLSACRRWSGRHGPLGVGIYFFAPVFFADVKSAWGLTRWQRVVVDCAGIYFQEICSIPLAALYLQSGNPIYLWTMLALDATLLMNLNPLARYDGYWLLSDALGVPNLHQRMSEILGFGIVKLARGLGLSARQRAQSSFLKHMSRWTYVALIGYTVVFVVAAVLFVTMLGPVLVRLASGLPAVMFENAQKLAENLAQANYLDAGRALNSLFWHTLVAINIVVLVLRLASRFVRRRRTTL
jgi:putative peptide zinc metalloprotease protein